MERKPAYCRFIIKGTAEHNIIFYRKEIANVFGKQKMIHINQQTDKMKESLGQNSSIISWEFIFMHMPLFLKWFWEVILQKNI